jgi:GTP cyclohydrolase II
VAVRILENFDVKSVRLITNNPIKIRALELAGIKVNERVELDDFANPENSRYLLTKAERMNHMLPLKNALSADN